jgi:hypothetical protein
LGFSAAFADETAKLAPINNIFSLFETIMLPFNLAKCK